MRTTTAAIALLILLAGAVAVSSAPEPAARRPGAPAAVSPGSARGIAAIEGHCPTFSWGAVPGTASYELAVYVLRGPSGEAHPVLQMTLPGSASSWTPGLGQCLERGGRYAWSVRAVGPEAVSDWSPPALFRVLPGPTELELEQALAVVRRYLGGGEEDGAPEEVAASAAAPPAEAPASGFPEALTPAATQLSVDGNIAATSFTGDGTNLAGVATDAEMSTHAGEADAHHAQTVDTTCDGAACDGSNLIGVATDEEMSTHAGEADAHHAPPTSLPPSGAAGGDLTGAYPNPQVGENAVGSAEIQNSSIALADLAFNPATQSELNTHGGTAAAHHAPTVDTTCHGAVCDGSNFTNLQWASLVGVPAGFDDDVDDTCAVTQNVDGTVTLTCAAGGAVTLDMAGAHMTQLSAGDSFTCGVQSGGLLACWGDDYNGESAPPGGTFIQVSAGEHHACAVGSDAAVDCWGKDYFGQSSPPAAETFGQVSAGDNHTCGVRIDGTVECWGSDSNGQASPPAATTWSQVSAGSQHTCGVTPDGVAECWGSDSSGQASPPAGTNFSQVSAGELHTCGVKLDGTVECWGSDSSGQASPPLGTTFSQVAAGDNHTCGIRSDGAVDCWGSDYLGQATPVEGNASMLNSLHASDFLRSNRDSVFTGSSLVIDTGSRLDVDGALDATGATSLQLPTAGISGGGHGSGLDADLLDGQDSSAFAPGSHGHADVWVDVGGDSMSGDLTIEKANPRLNLKRETDGLAGIDFYEAGTRQWIFPFFRGWQSDNLIVRDEMAFRDVMTFEAGTGHVGIGRSDPDAELDVVGVARIGAVSSWPSSGKGMELAYHEGLHKGYIQVFDRAEGGWGNLYLGDGRVGIGTAYPEEKLHVAGNLKLAGSGSGIIFPDGSTQTTATTIGVGGWTDDGGVVRLSTASDNVGIGTVSPAGRLHVDTAAGGKAVIGTASSLSPASLGYGLYGQGGDFSYGVAGAGKNGAKGYLGGWDFGVKSEGDLLVADGYLELTRSGDARKLRLRTSGGALDMDYSSTDLYFNNDAGNVLRLKQSGEITWTPQTSFVSLSDADFKSAYVGGCYHPRIGLAAPVHLPHGAALKKVTWYFDDSSPENAYLQLSARSFAGTGGGLAMSMHSWNGISLTYCPGSAECSRWVPMAVENNLETYELGLCVPEVDFDNRAVRIEYTVTKPH